MTGLVALQDCMSFNFADGECRLSFEAAVPTGSGELLSASGNDYYEKICLDPSLAANCPTSFERVPQFTLVGFAEEVPPQLEGNSLPQQYGKRR